MKSELNGAMIRLAFLLLSENVGPFSESLMMNLNILFFLVIPILLIVLGYFQL